MGDSSSLALVAFFVLCLALQARSNESDHRYKAQEAVPLYANKIGPFHNPSEAYGYYSLSFCSPDHVEEKKETFGEVLNGDHLVLSPYKLEFLVNKDSQLVCKKNLTRENVAQFRAAIVQDYYSQMYYDDLPIWAFIGTAHRFYDDTTPVNYKYELYTNIAFEIIYNKDRIIDIYCRTSPHSVVDVTEDKEIDVEFLYSVVWKEMDVSFDDRMDKYAQSSSLPHHMEIHWFSVMNSCVTIVVLVVCLVIFYIRKIKKDFNRMLVIIVLGVLGVFRPYSRGTLLTGLVVVYTVTSAIAGFSTVYVYCQLEGTNWVRNLLLTGSIFCGPLFITFCILNTIAAAYSASATIPVGTILTLLCIYVFGALPLLLFGGIAGKHSATEFESPCRTNKVPKEVPAQHWYRRVIPQMTLAGILPFGVIYVELYYLFASIWGHRIYTIYLILLIVSVLLLLITAFVTVAFTHFQLAGENHEWWWRSFLYGGSTGFYLFIYSLYYYYTKSDMSGLMQTSFFFGYMLCISYGFCLMLGAVGFYASLLFVRHIYGSIKCD